MPLLITCDTRTSTARTGRRSPTGPGRINVRIRRLWAINRAGKEPHYRKQPSGSDSEQ
ncbi:hypothetical protein BROSI_A1543 [Candidatus Brocadia sinica JPN1]|uniref:Uncharacterized protein n=1 Tax=Candidatus Brocadia sinica JPN1 TaxID=1197129 RepID=A0ABQ0JW80_9BACT|nr:hypothetical protein BROSI_A1543 [Candidatus Brocadia sinica JPN1]GIK14638.1 MAG: hypothetical protein BroJett002_33450 [Candidatus Brocadia sinica]GJQ16325.1 MAG: hypothetical protein HBSIN01_02840 [Candidatus Brocadia sinica]